MTISPPSLAEVAQLLASHAPLYRRRKPVYQTTMLGDLATAWVGQHQRVLDIGGGTGVLAEAIQKLLPAKHVVSIDVVDRYFKTLTVETMTYDGISLPFDNQSFEAATINNVMHHVPVDSRRELIQEVSRVVSGPIYIKDHLASSPLDHARLWALDAIGNIPFSGQIDADYLTMADWEALAADAGRRLVQFPTGQYRQLPLSAIFPNRLETVFRFDPV